MNRVPHSGQEPLSSPGIAISPIRGTGKGFAAQHTASECELSHTGTRTVRAAVVELGALRCILNQDDDRRPGDADGAADATQTGLTEASLASWGVVGLDEVTAYVGKSPRLQQQDPWQLGCLDVYQFVTDGRDDIAH